MENQPDSEGGNRLWHFYIDVGGTFTDCLSVSPAGATWHTKVLSSGRTKGRVERWSSKSCFFDRSRDESNRFWDDATVHFLDSHGRAITSTRIVRFDADNREFELAEPTEELVSGTVFYEIETELTAPLVAMHTILRLPLNKPLPPLNCQLGTTRGTNALITRTGARTAFVTTQGFKDLLSIGDQTRPELFALDIIKREPLCATSIGIDERILADGTVEAVPTESAVRERFVALKKDGIESVAVCLMHAFRYPQHEQLVGRIAREVGFEEVRLSSEVAPLIKILPRAETVALDAYLNPVLSNYLDEIESKLPGSSQLRMMTSSGGLVSRERFSGKDSVLSGPAGGVVGAVRVAEQLGYTRVIGFDMGGTSTDVSRYDGEFDVEYETVKAGVRLVTPTLAIETVAAGGGSICWFDGKRMRVGPASASADPGPACYGRQGPLTITDMNLFLGKIAVDHFPIPLNVEVVEVRLTELKTDLREAGFDLSKTEIARGFIEIANNEMAAAIRNVSVAKGFDPAEDVLVSFGGAGPQHCCVVAEKLGIKTIIDHPQSSILSAVGIQLAERKAYAARAMLVELGSDSLSLAEGLFGEMVAEVGARLIEENPRQTKIEFKYLLDLRYQGTEPCLTISKTSDQNFKDAFESLHRQLYGYVQKRDLEIVAARVEGVVKADRLKPCQLPESFVEKRSDDVRLASWTQDNTSVDVFQHRELNPGDLITGPAMIVDLFKTTIVESGWQAKTLAQGQLLLERTLHPVVAPNVDENNYELYPIQLEIFNRHFSSIALQMGQTLQRTSCSVNVKERLDFSCAIFTKSGDLVVNAPHIPVHLGAMSETVRATIRLNPDVQDGDVYVTNDPFAGGSHLPDITVVTPIFINDELEFWVASRSHHAELGGIAPGSMPANATRLGEEGVLIQNLKLVDAGEEQFDRLLALLTSGLYPSRSPEENAADIEAQIAANKRGESELRKLVKAKSIQTVARYMNFMSDAAEAKSREAISKLEDGEYRFEDRLDNGRWIRVCIVKRDSGLSFDFTGTDPVSPDNLNANRAIVQAAIMYVIRTLIDDNIPLNEGVIKPVSIELPVCFLNPEPAENPADSPAVVGGNVETSQRVVDVLLGALGLAAASQGTMNNWLMGDEEFGYYETVGGGSGATESGSGADAVHTHMTNTRLTDPEVLETRYPAVLREFSIRIGSGGKGRNSGGDGMIRCIEFTKPLRLSLLTNRRKFPPYGQQGGLSGALGRNLLIRKDGEQVELASQCEIAVDVGDQLILMTPGGGGFGIPS